MKTLSTRYSEAFTYALNLHHFQYRKGTRVPYIAHLMSVSALILENGGDEDQAIAGLLHDAVEDQGGIKTLEEIRSRFGDRVANIVEGCSDSYTLFKPPWRERKELYLAELARADKDIRLVSLADKVHNTRSLLWDLQQYGSAVWKRFNGGKEGTLWYYRALVDFFIDGEQTPLVCELNRVVSEIEQLAREE